MAKKFGKFLLFTAAAATAAAGVYYYMKKKEEKAICEVEDEDYDDFSEDLDETESRSYVQLDGSDDETAEEDFVEETNNAGDGDFAPLADQLQEKNDEQVEEFFDEESQS